MTNPFFNGHVERIYLPIFGMWCDKKYNMLQFWTNRTNICIITDWQSFEYSALKIAMVTALQNRLQISIIFVSFRKKMGLNLRLRKWVILCIYININIPPRDWPAVYSPWRSPRKSSQIHAALAELPHVGAQRRVGPAGSSVALEWRVLRTASDWRCRTRCWAGPPLLAGRGSSGG